MHGEVKLKDSRAPLCPNSTENDEVRLFEVTEIHQGCTIALTSLVEKVFAHQLQKEKAGKNAISGTHEVGKLLSCHVLILLFSPLGSLKGR